MTLDGAVTFVKGHFFLWGISKNSPFAIWPVLCTQLCVLKSPQYTKYSELSKTLFRRKSLAQIIKKELSEAAWFYVLFCQRKVMKLGTNFSQSASQ